MNKFCASPPPKKTKPHTNTSNLKNAEYQNLESIASRCNMPLFNDSATHPVYFFLASPSG